MKKYIIFLLLIFGTISVFSQNLLKFGSFEQVDTILNKEFYTSNKYCKKIGDELKFIVCSNDSNARLETIPSK